MFESVPGDVVSGVVVAAILGAFALAWGKWRPKPSDPEGPEPGVWVAARVLRNAGTISSDGPVTIYSDDAENTGAIRAGDEQRAERRASESAVLDALHAMNDYLNDQWRTDAPREIEDACLRLMSDGSKATNAVRLSHPDSALLADAIRAIEFFHSACGVQAGFALGNSEGIRNNFASQHEKVLDDVAACRKADAS